MLKAKLYLLQQQENAEKLSGIRGEVKGDWLGKPDPFLCHAAVYDGKKTTERMQKQEMWIA